MYPLAREAEETERRRTGTLAVDHLVDGARDHGFPFDELLGSAATTQYTATIGHHAGDWSPEPECSGKNYSKNI